MEAKRIDSELPDSTRVDWEAFYRSYRKPGYLAGFEIVNKLGGGMFGLVFKARKESIGKDYAIKFLKVDDDSIRDAVMREIDNVSYFAQIDHPNLVSIEDKGTVDGIPYLVMNYAGDETLQKRLQQGPMTRDGALHLFVQAARGVQALHDHSLVHFDLKPANIFLKGDVARVGDYGLSKLVSASRNSLSFGRGTPYYMAPEMLKRRGDARSDVYSLGILLYECLYGEVPFRGESEWEVLRKHETAAPEFPESALTADREVILRCLAKQPEGRFQSAADLLRALQAPVALGESMMLAPGKQPSPTHAEQPPPIPPTAPASQAISEAATRPQSDPVSSRRAKARPKGMPFHQGKGHASIVGFLVGLVFSLVDMIVCVILWPSRAIRLVRDHGIGPLLRLPLRLPRLAKQIIVVLWVVALAVLIVVTVVSLFGVQVV